MSRPLSLYRLGSPILIGSRPCLLRQLIIQGHPSRSARQQHAVSESRLPRIAQPSFWRSMIPRSWQKQSRDVRTKEKQPNPSTYFIWIYILIGSQAIRIMQVKNEFNTFIRKADLKLEKLREVIRKVQNGEEVDVEKVLGTGDEVQEQEWEDALREIQEEEVAWQESRKKQKEASEQLAAKEQDASPVNESLDKALAQPVLHGAGQSAVPVAPGFY